MVSNASAGAVSELTTVKESHYMQTQPWALQQVEQEDAQYTAAAPATPSSTILTYRSDQNWSGGSASSFDWNGALQQAQPYIVPNSDPQFHQNHALVYDPTPALQNTIEKTFGDVRTSWASSGINGLPRGMTADKSVLSTSMSPSPKSYLSDDFENTYSPVSILDQASPCGNWKASPVTGLNAALSSSSCRSFLPQNVDGNIGCSALPRMGADIAIATVSSDGSSRLDRAPIAPFEDDQQSGSEYSRSRNSSAGHSPWYGLNYSYDTTSLPFRTRNVATYSNPTSDTSFSSTEEARPTQYHSAPWSNSRPSTHVQYRTQDRFQVPRNDVAQAQREHNDQLLIDGKKRGETYKEIKLKMVGEKPAESTLRGRFRSLTKARKDRVRKPIWTKIDVSQNCRRHPVYSILILQQLELLDEIVQQEFDRIESHLQNPYSLRIEQKILKVAWKKVAEFIAENGGSYHFGNATCKRKWLERNQGQK